MSDDDAGFTVLSAMVQPGTTEEDVRGVVFYRLPEDDLPRPGTLNILKALATMFQPSVLRYGFMSAGDGFYWVGLNHLKWGDAFEGALIALKVKGVTKKLKLPGGNPYPELRRIVQPGRLPKPDRPDRVAQARELFSRIRLPKRKGT